MARAAIQTTKGLGSANSTTAISGLRISDEMLRELRTDYKRRVAKDDSIPDRYNWSDHLRYLLRKGMESSEY